MTIPKNEIELKALLRAAFEEGYKEGQDNGRQQAIDKYINGMTYECMESGTFWDEHVERYLIMEDWMDMGLPASWRSTSF